jgi:hypothetical protein
LRFRRFGAKHPVGPEPPLRVGDGGGLFDSAVRANDGPLHTRAGNGASVTIDSLKAKRGRERPAWRSRYDRILRPRELANGKDPVKPDRVSDTGGETDQESEEGPVNRGLCKSSTVHKAAGHVSTYGEGLLAPEQPSFPLLQATRT